VSRLSTFDYTSDMQNFSRGVVSGTTDRKRGRPTWLKDAENLYGRPLGSASIRPGSRDLSDATLPEAPHSLLKYYAAGGGALFAGAGTHIYLVTATGYPLVVLPITPTNNEWSHDNLNGVMIATQRLTPANLPIIYNGTSWMSLKLPVPANTLTLTPGVGAGAMTVNTTYYYRLRWLFRNGASLASTPQLATMGVGDNQVVITTIPVTGGGRSDYLGWRLERTESGATSAGPFYFVADGTANNYTDQTADSNLDYRADEGIHGDPPPMDGVIAFANRLIGWYGSALYPSQSPGDLEATGICNYDPELTVYASKDDGDTIQTCVVVGDELLILKRRSVWRLVGTGPENFQLVPVVAGSGARGGEAGAVGPRAACAIGNAAYFWGDGGIFRYAAGRVDPAGWVEMGKYMSGVNKAIQDQIVMVNQIGDYVLVFNSQSPFDYNSHCLLYDARLNQWWPWRGWFARDAIVVKDGSLGDATLVFCDSRPADATGTFTDRPAFHVWQDTRGTTQVYVQKVLSASGAVQWTANGVVVSAAGASGTLYAQVRGLDDGGCIVAFLSLTAGNYTARAQRFNSAGVAQWAAGGVALSNNFAAPSGNGGLRIITDGSVDGSIVVWGENSAGGAVKAQKINGVGAVQWTAGGVAVHSGAITSIAGDTEDSIGLFSDGLAGAYVFYVASTGGADIGRIQHLDSGGALLNGVDGVNMGLYYRAIRVADGSFYALSFSGGDKIKKFDGAGVVAWTSTDLTGGTPFVNGAWLVDDNEGGVIAAWVVAAANKVYARRVNGAGAVQWSAATVVDTITATVGQILTFRAVPDGVGGIVVAWTRGGGAGTRTVQCARVDADGNILWGPTGVTTATADQFPLGLITDGAASAIVQFTNGSDSYEQRFDPSGARLYGTGGIAVSAAANNQTPRASAYTGAAYGEVVAGSGAGYHVWIGFDGFKDEKDRAGAGGNAVPWLALTPFIDDADKVGAASNQPKEFGRLQTYINTDPSSVTAAIILEPGSRVVSIPLAVGVGGAEWGDDTATIGDDTAVWDEFDWGQDEQAPSTSAFPVGTIGTRYAMQYSGVAADDMQFQGFELDAVLTPERRTDQ